MMVHCGRTIFGRQLRFYDAEHKNARAGDGKGSLRVFFSGGSRLGRFSRYCHSASQYAQIYVVLSVYTFVVTLVFICILYMMMHGFGELDRKPYQWARYNMKGFACAAQRLLLIVSGGNHYDFTGGQIYYR